MAHVVLLTVHKFVGLKQATIARSWGGKTASGATPRQRTDIIPKLGELDS